jgi:hypothetical protein
MTGQIFRTLPGGAPGAAVYQLSIRSPGQQFAELSTYTFPLSPSSVKYAVNALSTYNETQGSPQNQGVTRVIDTYGLSPPIIDIEGTTGYDRHTADGYILTGIESITLLRKFLSTYALLNQQQQAAGNPQMYSLEFYDFYSSSFYQIEPVGPQIFRQTNDRPLLMYYRFHWAAVAPVSAPILELLDILLQTFETPAEQAVTNAIQTIGAIATAYGPTGLSLPSLS